MGRSRPGRRGKKKSVDPVRIDPKDIDPVNLMRDRLTLTVSGLPADKWAKLNAKMASICLSKSSESGESIDAFNALLEARKVDLTASKILVDAITAAVGVNNPAAPTVPQLGRDELAELVIEHVDRIGDQREVEPVAGSVAAASAEVDIRNGESTGPALGQAVGDDARGGPVAAASSNRPPVRVANLCI